MAHHLINGTNNDKSGLAWVRRPSVFEVNSIGVICALFLPFVALALQKAFWPALSPMIWVTFYPAIIVAPFIGGALGGLAATLISALIVWYVFIPPEQVIGGGFKGQEASILVFVASGMVASAVRAYLGRLFSADATRHELKAIRESALQFATMSASLTGVLCSFRQSPDGGFSMPFASSQIFDVYGLVAEQVRNDLTPLWERIHPEDAARMLVSIEASRIKMTPWQDEWRYEHPTKGEIWLEGRSAPKTEPDGGTLWHGYVQDVTERVRAQIALIDREIKYRNLVEASPEAILINRAGLVAFANEACVRLFHAASDAELVGRDAMSLFHADYHDMIRERMALMLMGESVPLIEERIQCCDGRQVEVEVIAAPVYFDGVMAFHVQMRDITDRKRDEGRIERLNRTMRAVSQSRLALLHAADLSSYLSEVCRIMVEVCGYPLAWIGLAQQDTDKSVLPVASAGDVDYLGGLRVSWGDDRWGCGPSGMSIKTGKAQRFVALDDDAMSPWRERYITHGLVSGIAIPLKREGQAPYGTVCIYAKSTDAFTVDELQLLTDMATDIAFGMAILETREAVAENEAMLRSITDQVIDPIFMLDRSGRLRFANPAAIRMLKANNPSISTLSPDQMIGQHEVELFGRGTTAKAAPPPDRLVQEDEINGPEGLRIFQTVRSPIKDSAGQVVGSVSAARDITERKREEERRIRELEIRRDALVAEVHHRIKNHLQGVTGLIRIRAAKIPEFRSEFEEIIAQIQVIANAYGLQTDRGEHGVSVAKLMKMACKTAISQVSVECYCDMPEDDLWLRADDVVPVAVALNELITNAVKHTAAQDGTPPVSVHLTVQGMVAVVTIRNGPATLPPGFDFERGIGLGMGLDLVRVLLPQQDAHISFRQDGPCVVSELALTCQKLDEHP